MRCLKIPCIYGIYVQNVTFHVKCVTTEHISFHILENKRTMIESYTAKNLDISGSLS